MILTYCYRIKPSVEQEAAMFYTLERLRRHWNYCLSQRLDWLRRTRCQVDRCSIISEPIGEIPDKVDYSTQQSELKQTKVLSRVTDKAQRSAMHRWKGVTLKLEALFFYNQSSRCIDGYWLSNEERKVQLSI